MAANRNRGKTGKRGAYLRMKQETRFEPTPTIGHNGGPPLSFKDTNPKDAVGTKKWRVYTTVPMTVIWELGVAMLEGARKYGRHNYRVAGVRASVYVDAAKGHIDSWWEGEDIDSDSRLSHITKAIASLTVLRDAMIQGKFVDDRPPRTNLLVFRTELQKVVDGIFERIPNAVPAYVEGDQHPEDVDGDLGLANGMFSAPEAQDFIRRQNAMMKSIGFKKPSRKRGH